MQNRGLKRIISNGGFALLKVMLICAIVGVVALMFVPAYLGQDSEKQLVAASRELENALRFVRGKAMAENKEITVSFDTAAESFVIIETASGDAVLKPGTSASYSVVFPDSRYKGVNLLSVNGVEGVRAAIFRPSGLPDATVRVAMTRGLYSRTVMVNENTGNIWTQSP